MVVTDGTFITRPCSPRLSCRIGILTTRGNPRKPRAATDCQAFVSQSRAWTRNVVSSLHEARTARSESALLEGDQGGQRGQGSHPDRAWPAYRRHQTDQGRT